MKRSFYETPILPGVMMCARINKLIMIIGIISLCALAGCGSTTSTAAITVTASTLPAQNSYLSHPGTLILSDPLKDNSKGYKWDETALGNASCGFSEGAYHVKIPQQGGIICNPEAKSLFLSNLTYEISLKTIQGEIEGIVFRYNQSNSTGYTFFIDTQTGKYSLNAANGTSTPFKLLLSGSSSAIKTGLNQSNVLAVVAVGSTISLYINNQFIAKANDSTYSQGQLGIFTADSQGPADVEASNARAWTP